MLRMVTTSTEPAAEPEPERDPVCGMKVRPESPHRVTMRDRELGFCGARCREKFEADPDRYLSAASTAPGEQRAEPARTTAAVAASNSGARRWICPMDPEVVSDRPGVCAKCGMALEPGDAVIDDDNPELASMQRWLLLSALFAVPLLALVMGEMVLGRPLVASLTGQVRMLLELLLASPVVLSGGWPFFERAWRQCAPGTSTCSRSSAWAWQPRTPSA
jgi:Cu+-exporting ATPase